jgi:hypothetical protein
MTENLAQAREAWRAPTRMVKKWSKVEFPVPGREFPVPSKKFPVPLRRELFCKRLNLLDD